MKKETRVQEQPAIDFSETTKRFNKELNEMRKDFFDKLQEVQEQFSKVYSDIFEIKNQSKQELDEETIVGKVLQKVSVQPNTSSSINEEAIISKVLARVPKSTGSVVYEVAPQVKLKKDFLEEAKNKVINDINLLNERSKKILKFIESLGRRTNISEVMEKGLLVKPSSGSRSVIQKEITELFNLEVARKDGGHIYPNLKEKAKKYMETHEATEQEIEQVYNHILMEMLK